MIKVTSSIPIAVWRKIAMATWRRGKDHPRFGYDLGRTPEADRRLAHGR